MDILDRDSMFRAWKEVRDLKEAPPSDFEAIRREFLPIAEAQGWEDWRRYLEARQGYLIAPHAGVEARLLDFVEWDRSNEKAVEPWLFVHGLFCLGVIYDKQSKVTEALSSYDELVRFFRATDDGETREVFANALFNAFNTASDAKREDAAEAYLGELRALDKEHDEPHAFEFRRKFGLILHAIRTKALCLLAAVLVLLSIPCLGEEVQAAEQLTLDLTPEERAFLVEHPVLKLGVGVAFPPFQYVEDEDGRRLFKGMVADTVLLLEQRLGVRMTPVWDITFAQALDMGEAGAIDVFPCIAWTPERAEFLAFTRPYLSYPLVIVSRDDTTFIGAVEELHGRKVAEVKALATYSKFINDLPHLAIDFVFEKDTQAMLEAVSLGKAEACVVDLAVATYVINKRGLTNLKVAAPTRWDETRLAMAVPKHRAILANILQKALDSFTFNEKDALRQRWIGLKISPLMNPILFRRILLQGGGAALLVVAVILWWNRRLRLEMAERKRAEDALRESEEQFDLFMKHCPIYVFFKDENIRTIRLSRNYEKMLGRPLKDLMGKSMYDLFPPQLAKSIVDDDMRVLREGAPVTVEECFGDRIYTTTKFSIKREGKPPLIAGFTIDITERNRNEELRRQVETIIQHDLRTPAGFAVSLASALRGDINLTDQQRDLLERMEHAGLEMLDTLSRSLTLFKIETGQYQCVLKSLDCLPLVRELARNMPLRPQFKSTRLEIVMDGQPLPSDAVYPCICEAELLRPALNNILEQFRLEKV